MKSRITIMVVLICAVFALPAFALQSDEVRSRHIDEADGTSGQDTNSGSGVKTGHIQDGAVTPAKIGFYKNVIVVAPSGGDFTNPADALNAISDASATNPYLVKIMPGVYNIGANSLLMQEYVDLEGSGESVTKITGAGGADNPSGYSALVVGASNSGIRFLTLEGSGSTTLLNYGASAKINHMTIIITGVQGETAVIRNMMASPEITNVTILGYGSDYVTTGISNYGTGSPIINNVNITLLNGGPELRGISNSWGVTPVINNVQIKASGASTIFGILNEYYTLAFISDVVVDVSGAGYRNIGILNRSGSDTQLQNVVSSAKEATGDNWGIWSNNGNVLKIDSSIVVGGIKIYDVSGVPSKVYVGNSKVQGQINNQTGILKCIGVYDENYNPVACP